MAAAKGGTPLSSAPSFALPLNVSVQLSSSTHCSVSCVRLQSCHRQPVYLIDLELAKASGVDIRALRLLNNYTPSRWSPQPLIWGDRGRDRECVHLCVCVPGMCEFLGAEEREAGWRDESRRME